MFCALTAETAMRDAKTADLKKGNFMEKLSKR
jgi:hypothetical protein